MVKEKKSYILTTDAATLITELAQQNGANWDAGGFRHLKKNKHLIKARLLAHLLAMIY